MIKRPRIIKPILVFFILFHSFSPSVLVFAQEAPTSEPVVEAAPLASDTTTSETTQPPVEEDPYVFNEQTGLWENSKYGWNPETFATSPVEQESEFSYNPETSAWDTPEWEYDPTSGGYVENLPTTTTSQELEPSTIEDSEQSSSGVFDSFFNASISNNLNSTASSGDATVTSNTLAGSALTGDALTMANIINAVNSSLGMPNSSLTTFLYNVEGNMVGDLIIDTTSLDNTNLEVSDDLEISQDLSVDVNVDNTIDLLANSGDAAVSNNTQAGNATTGDATAILNLVNLLNSTVATGNLFLGVININGSLDGDILFPEGALQTILASNNTVSQSSNASSLTDITSNQQITNAINLSASSGDALVDGNTHAGSAVTGDASTGLTLLNLSSQTIVGKNTLLVFVNVMGQWIGLILDAPGATSAAIGDGSSTAEALSVDAQTSYETNHSINNNINLSANSGDASVINNTSAGGSTTGDASAVANIANISRTQFSLSDWFGVLFINVFGLWNGSFGIDTSAGLPVTPSTPSDRGSNNAMKPSRSPFSFRTNVASTTTSIDTQPTFGGDLSGLSFDSRDKDSMPKDNKALLAFADTPKGPTEAVNNAQATPWTLLLGLIGASYFGIRFSDQAYKKWQTKSV